MKFIIIIFSLVFLISCKNSKDEKPDNRSLYKNLDENLAKTNQILAVSEDDQIYDLIRRRGWKMEKTGTGLRYNIYEKTNGPKSEKFSIIRFNMKVELINGFVCYDSKEEGYYEIQIGKSTAPNGLEEGLLMMREGEKALFILPSHLAFGLLGDQDKIPSRSILLYNVEVLQIRN